MNMFYIDKKSGIHLCNRIFIFLRENQVIVMFFEEYEKCTLCPRMCKVNRNKNLRGFCGETSTLRMGRASLHMWEEPCISGERGSGTVFFAGCNLKCCYCQNYKLSRGQEGVELGEKSPVDIFLDLQKQGAHNINLVTGEHFAPHIREAVLSARKRGLEIPVILNSSGYVTEQTLEYLKDVIDIYLVDFKYMNSVISENYSMAQDYPQVVKTALEKMYNLAGNPVLDENGILRKGIIVRHLCLPEHADDSKEIIRYIYNRYGENVLLSIMSQYTPFGNCEKYPELTRKLTSQEYDEIIDFCIDLGIENAFVQEEEAASESFIPEFDGKGVVF